jgi:hypothetical protein
LAKDFLQKPDKIGGQMKSKSRRLVLEKQRRKLIFNRDFLNSDDKVIE